MPRLILTILLRRLGAAIPTLFFLSLIVFLVLRMIPADPLGSMLPPNATPADAQALRKALGMDQPLPAQFLIWVENAVTGDLGNSISYHQPVRSLIASTLPSTIELCVSALLVSLLISIPGGVLAYVVAGKRSDVPVSLAVVLMQSVPAFLWALLLMILLGVILPILPFSGRADDGYTSAGITGFYLLDFLITGQLGAWFSTIRHLVLPSVSLAFGFAPLVIRVLRSSLIDQATESYVAVARLRGTSERRILWLHMLKNASLPALTMIGVQFGFLFGSALLVEMIFSYPGIGNLMIQAVRSNDMVLIQGIAVVFCALMLLINAIVDTLYVLLNPRLRKTA
ncbi:MAG TPA: ABC transporter permease [Bordetella sp.]